MATVCHLANISLRLGRRVRWDAELSPQEVAAALDESWALVLPSLSEGMGRVLVEAFCRGRGVVGTRAGSIPNLVEDGVSGVLVELPIGERDPELVLAEVARQSRQHERAAHAEPLRRRSLPAHASSRGFEPLFRRFPWVT